MTAAQVIEAGQHKAVQEMKLACQSADVSGFNAATSRLTDLQQDWFSVYANFLAAQGLAVEVVGDRGVDAFVDEITTPIPDSESFRIMKMIRSMSRIVPIDGVPISTGQLVALISQEIREGRIAAWGANYSKVTDAIEDAENATAKHQQ